MAGQGFMKEMDLRLKISADTSEMEKSTAEAFDRVSKDAKGPAGFNMGSNGLWTPGGAGAELAQGQMKDQLREVVSALKEVAAAMNGGGGVGGSGGIPGVPGSQAAPGGGGGGGGFLGSLLGRNGQGLHPWEVQRLMSDPAGGIYGMASSGLIANAARIAMMPVGEAMGAGGIGAAGVAGVGGLALLAGYKYGSHIVDGIEKDGLAVNRAILDDIGIAGATGYDIRGARAGIFEDDRHAPKADYMRNIDYVRRGVGAFGASAKGANNVDKMAEDVVYMAKNQLGIAPEALGGFVGASWQSGAAGQNDNDTTALLKRIANSTELGKDNMVTSNETLKSLTSLMAAEQASSGSVGAGQFQFMNNLYNSMQKDKTPELMGERGAQGIQGLMNNQSKLHVGLMWNHILNADNSFSALGNKMLKNKFKNGLPAYLKGRSNTEIAAMMVADGEMKLEFDKEFAQGGGLNGIGILGEANIFGGKVGFPMAAQVDNLKHGDMTELTNEHNWTAGSHGSDPNGPQSVAAEREEHEAQVAFASAISNTAASANYLSGILQKNIMLKQGGLAVSRGVFSDATSSSNSGLIPQSGETNWHSHMHGH